MAEKEEKEEKEEKMVIQIKKGPLNDKGEYTIYGTYIFYEFRTDTLQISSDIDAYNDVKFGFRFLDHFNQPNSNVRLVVFLKCEIESEYPMVLLAKIHNFEDKNKSKKAKNNVVFSPKAKRSYLEFNFTWIDLLEKKNGFTNNDGHLVINYEFQHTIIRQKIEPVSWKELIYPKEPDSPRSVNS